MRTVVAGRDVLLRECLASLLQGRGHSMVDVAGGPANLLRLVREHDPGLVIVVAGLEPMHSVELLMAAEQIRLERPEIGILVLATHGQVEHAEALLATGHGVGYLLMDRVVDAEDLFDGLRQVARGGCVLDPAVIQELEKARHRNDPFALLSNREFDVLALMAEGRSNLGIARELSISEGTIEKHVRSILMKLDLSGGPSDHRRVLAVLAFRHARGADLSAASRADGREGKARASEQRRVAVCSSSRDLPSML